MVSVHKSWVSESFHECATASPCYELSWAYYKNIGMILCNWICYVLSHSISGFLYVVKL